MTSRSLAEAGDQVQSQGFRDKRGQKEARKGSSKGQSGKNKTSKVLSSVRIAKTSARVTERLTVSENACTRAVMAVWSFESYKLPKQALQCYCGVFKGSSLNTNANYRLVY